MWPMCGGLNVPPRMPRRRVWWPFPELRAHLARAVDHVLERRQLAQPDRAARVELLRGVPHLGAHAELRSVGEASGGVDVYASGVHRPGERRARLFIRGHDRLGVTRAVPV